MNEGNPAGGTARASKDDLADRRKPNKNYSETQRKSRPILRLRTPKGGDA